MRPTLATLTRVAFPLVLVLASPAVLVSPAAAGPVADHVVTADCGYWIRPVPATNVAGVMWASATAALHATGVATFVTCTAYSGTTGAEMGRLDQVMLGPAAAAAGPMSGPFGPVITCVEAWALFTDAHVHVTPRTCLVSLAEGLDEIVDLGRAEELARKLETEIRIAGDDVPPVAAAAAMADVDVLCTPAFAHYDELGTAVVAITGDAKSTGPALATGVRCRVSAGGQTYVAATAVPGDRAATAGAATFPARELTVCTEAVVVLFDRTYHTFDRGCRVV